MYSRWQSSRRRFRISAAFRRAFISRSTAAVFRRNYAVALVGATRSHPLILRGASPRATLSVTAMAKAAAYMQGRDYVVPKDIQAVFVSTVTHRLLMTPESEAKGIAAQTVLEEILKSTPAPRI